MHPKSPSWSPPLRIISKHRTPFSFNKIVYANYDAIKDEDGEHHAILLCCENDEDENTQGFYVENDSKELFF